MNKTLVILAAGIGSRYGGLKQMDPVGPSGEFIVDYSVFDAIRAGFNRVVFVIRRDIEDAFRMAIGRRVEPHIDTKYVFQELDALPEGYAVPVGREKPWGTGHAILVCRDAVDGPFGVVNADDFYGQDAYETMSRFMERSRDNAGEMGMIAFKLSNTLSDHGTVSRGVCRVSAGGKLETVVELTAIGKTDDSIICSGASLNGDELASMNMWAFKPWLFDSLDEQFREFLDLSKEDPKSEFFIPDVVNCLVEERKATVSVLSTDSRWFGVTYPEDKAGVVHGIRRLIDTGIYPESLWK
ncbi:MAG: sugar phosphate nucleotidyltransferase [Kiritimatiellia bacterium]|jgi:UTP-glucose-1-phosphate uridylyltransferase|nr:sugar phosphate nucleotidyltransferase [Kiritimatiellia bacterium]